MPTLLEQLRTVIRRKHYAMRTEDAYVGWVRDFIRFHDKRHPASLAEGHVTRYLSHLAVERRVSASTQNQALSALLFLYRNVLDRPLGDISGAVRAKQPQRLPVVFTQDEVTGPLERLQGPTWLICALLYGAGLRLLEGLRLRVKDPEFERQAIYVRDGKGAKDRVTVLPADLTESLQRHLANVQTTFERDRTRGLAGVYVPFALARKYPDAPIEWRWQWVLPAPGTSVDPREQPNDAITSAGATRVPARAAIGRHPQTRKSPHAAAQLRHSPARRRLRHSHRAGATRSRRRRNHADLHPCAEARRQRRAEPARQALASGAFTLTRQREAARFRSRSACPVSCGRAGASRSGRDCPCRARSSPRDACRTDPRRAPNSIRPPNRPPEGHV